MATRVAVQASREALYQYLRQSCLDGTLVPGAMLPTVRELSEQHGVTAHAVFQVIQRLCDEGMVYTVPRVGAFVGHPSPETVEPYLMVMPPHESAVDHYLVQAQFGFEDRIAQLGGHSIIATPVEARQYLERDDLPRVSGIFESLESVLHPEQVLGTADVPTALLGRLEEFDGSADCVSFDDEAGGAQAVRHLIQNGHQVVAFLGLHCPEAVSVFPWSRRREIGWQRAMEQAGNSVAGLAFYPKQAVGFHRDGQRLAGQQAAEGLIGRRDISAVVAANVLAAEGMFQAFREAKWPAEEWPAVVCFDCIPGAGGSVVSYLRLPWEDIGREVAQLLRERRTGRLSGPPVQRLVPMRLIARLSCRADWAVSSGVTLPQCVASVASEMMISQVSN